MSKRCIHRHLWLVVYMCPVLRWPIVLTTLILIYRPLVPYALEQLYTFYLFNCTGIGICQQCRSSLLESIHRFESTVTKWKAVPLSDDYMTEERASHHVEVLQSVYLKMDNIFPKSYFYLFKKKIRLTPAVGVRLMRRY